MHKCEKKLEDSDKILKSNPEDSSVWFEKGKLYLRLGEPEKSRKAF